MKRLFFLTLLVSSVFAFSDIMPTKYYSVAVFSIEDKKLEPILDSILAIDKTRYYYRSDKYFSIGFHWDSVIQISALSFLVAVNGGANPTGDLGVFEYKGHSFFISGVYYDRRIFRPTGEKTRYKYYTKRGVIDDKGMFHTLLFDGDGYNKWQYRYTSDGSFELIDFSDTSKPPQPPHPVTYPARLMHLPTFNISYPAKVEKINFGPTAK